MSYVNCHQKQVIHHFFAARRKKPAYGMNDAPAVRGYGMLPTRPDRCCYVLYSSQSRKQALEHWVQGAIAQHNGTKDAFTESHERSEMEAAFEKNAGSHSWKSSNRKIRAKDHQSILWIISLEQVEKKWNDAGLTRLRKDVQVGSKDWNDVAFTGQRIRWTQDSQNSPCIEVSQNKAIDELEEVPVERNTKEDLHYTPSMHTMYRGLLGQMNWLQSGTQFQCCHNFPGALRWQLLQQLAM